MRFAIARGVARQTKAGQGPGRLRLHASSAPPFTRPALLSSLDACSTGWLDEEATTGGGLRGNASEGHMEHKGLDRGLPSRALVVLLGTSGE